MTGLRLVEGGAGERDRQWVLQVPGRPKTANEYRRLHWRVRAAYDAEWRREFNFAARVARVPRLERVVVYVSQGCAPGTPLPDPGNTYETAKAAIDGLRDARVIVDDDGRYVAAVVLLAPERDVVDSFSLVVVEHLDDEAPVEVHR